MLEDRGVEGAVGSFSPGPDDQMKRRLLTAVTASDVLEERTDEQQMFTRLKALLKFYRESELHKHVVYLVDSLWDCGGALLKDWPTFTSVLLQEPSGFTLTEEELLVEILVASVRQASEGLVLAGRSGAKKVMNAREKKTQTEDCLKITEHLLGVLPQLLSKFSCHADVVASLMRIPQFFLSEGPEATNTQALRSLMAEMAAVLDLHSSPAVLEAGARSFLSLCGGETGWSCMAMAARDAVVQRWVEQLTELLRNSLTAERFFADEEMMTEILTTLKKLIAFQNCHDLSRWSLFELLSPLLLEESFNGGAPPELVQEVLQCISFIMIWSLNTSSQTLTCREKAASQRLHLRLFCDSSHRRLSHPDLAVRTQAFLGVCDVLTAHSYQLHVWDPSSFGPLLYTPSPKLQRALLTFVCAHVFIGADCHGQNPMSENSEVEKLEDLHRRRNLLAAYCKLVVHGVLEISSASAVFMFYVKYYNDFGDIIKETLCRTRQVDKIESARALVLCLQQLFVQLKREQGSGGKSHPGVQTFTSIKELARRFALTFGDLVKLRECVVMIHRNGIEFVFQEPSKSADMTAPAYLSYLTILSEFSSKLLKPDRKMIFSYLQKYTAEHVVELRDECWQPLIYYRASLLAVAEGEDAASHASSDRRPYRPFSKQKHEGSKSPCPFSPVDSKVSKVHRASVGPSSQKSPVLLEPPATILNSTASILSTSSEVGEGLVEVEL
ncbi:cohesin subunit SA-2-like [Xenentodon cancila]